MVSKKGTVTLPVLTVIIALLYMAAPAMGATWMVNPDGSGDFTTIQAAVNSNWTSGDTIQIAYAVYREPVFVDADGGELTIMGVLSQEGDLPVIDGMNGAVAPEMPDRSFDDYGCGQNTLDLYDGSFTVSDLRIINASVNGIVARANDDGQVFYASGIEVSENDWCGMNVRDFSDAGVTDITASDNGYAGIHMKSNLINNVTDVLCYENGGAGLQISGDDVVIDGVIARENDWRGVMICLETMYRDTVSGEVLPDSGMYPGCTITDILASDNGGDGLFVREEGYHAVDISGVESIGNGGDGVCLNGLSDFSVRYLTLAENGWESVPYIDRGYPDSVCEDDVMPDEAYCGLGCGNGLGMIYSEDGLVEYVESVNNSVAGIYLKRSDGITLRYVVAAEHSLNSLPLMDDTAYRAEGAGISEKITSYTVIEDSLSYNNYVDYAYEGMCDRIGDDGESVPYDGYPVVLGLQISDPSNENIIPTILSWESDCNLLWIGQPNGQIDLFPLPRYHDAGGMYAEVMGASGDTVDLAFVIPPEFPSTTAEGLSLWNFDWYYRETPGWVQPADTYNTIICGVRNVGTTYTFPGLIDVPADTAGSFNAGWAASSAAPDVDGYSGASYDTLFAPFWYEQPGGDDPGAGGVATPVPTNAAPGDEQTGGTGTGAGSDGATPTPTPVPTTAPVDGEGDVNETATMTPAPVGESASPTVPVTQMPADAGASGNSPLLPWAVLILVLAVMAGGVYFTKSRQK